MTWCLHITVKFNKFLTFCDSQQHLRLFKNTRETSTLRKIMSQKIYPSTYRHCLQMYGYKITKYLEFIFGSSINFKAHISQLSQTCYAHSHDLRRLSLDKQTAYTITTSIVHSKLDNCNSFNNLCKAANFNQFKMLWITQ